MASCESNKGIRSALPALSSIGHRHCKSVSSCKSLVVCLSVCMSHSKSLVPSFSLKTSLGFTRCVSNLFEFESRRPNGELWPISKRSHTLHHHVVIPLKSFQSLDCKVRKCKVCTAKFRIRKFLETQTVDRNSASLLFVQTIRRTMTLLFGIGH